MIHHYDYVVFGAGIYGMYAAKVLAEKGRKVAIIEYDTEPFGRASYINQARVHNGYHYPRSVSTAAKSAKYYQKFNEDFSFAVNDTFKKIYAVSSISSLANAEQFLKFCRYVGIPAEEINAHKYFNKGMVEAAFETDEYSFDAMMIKNWLLQFLRSTGYTEFFFNTKLQHVENEGDRYKLVFNESLTIITPRVLNATYASINQILEKFGFPKFKIKYEMCELILANVNDIVRDIGITVMDGPFFSLMPFGYTGTHSLTAVEYTPHKTSFGELPTFSCQAKSPTCSPDSLDNCNTCIYRPNTSWKYMNQIAKKYLIPEINIQYQESLFALKAILVASELDDSRPTVVKTFSNQPLFITVLSGKFNTIYDLEDVLLEDQIIVDNTEKVLQV